MIKRKIQPAVVASLQHFPVVGILGSRQVGKTTLARTIQKQSKSQSVYLDLELPSDLNKMGDPELYFSQYADRLIIIDEIQRMPDLFPVLRALADQRKTAGRFLILGSASPQLIKHASESLAGRIIYHPLTPFLLKELDQKKPTIEKLWLRGGYPKSFLAKNNGLSFEWREAFIQSHLERDLPQLGVRIGSVQLRRFLTMMAHNHGQLWNASTISKSLGLSAPTVKHYLDLLENTFLIRQLQPYHANLKKRMVKSPKVYIRDSGLLHALLGNMDWESLQGHPGVGHSWEGFVIEQILEGMPKTWKGYFYRTSAGAEIDLVLFRDQKEPIAIEIKYSLSPQISKGFWSGFRDMSCKKGYVVYPGKEAYGIDRSIEALPMSELVKIFQ